MSKPTLSYFCVHSGYYRNDRTLALHEKVGPHAFYVMPMLWSWAAENQMDGEVSHLTTRRYQQIFKHCNLDLTIPQTKRIIEAIHVVGFIQDGKLHSWEKFNRHCVDYEKRLMMKRDAASFRWQRSVQKGLEPQETAEEPSPKGNGAGHETASKKLWVIDQALKTATGPAKRKLKQQRKELLSETTGVDLDETDSSPSSASPPPRHPHSSSQPQKLKRRFSDMRAAVDGNPVPE